jgi:hypothetical protein
VVAVVLAADQSQDRRVAADPLVADLVVLAAGQSQGYKGVVVALMAAVVLVAPLGLMGGFVVVVVVAEMSWGPKVPVGSLVALVAEVVLLETLGLLEGLGVLMLVVEELVSPVCRGVDQGLVGCG